MFYEQMFVGTPVQIPDGRYFLKVSGVRHQVNNVTLSVADATVTIPADVTLFSEIDETIVTQAKENKVAWFGKEISDDTVVAAYQKSLTPERDLSASFVTIKGEVVTTAYDSQKKAIDLTKLSPTSPVDVLLELTGLMFTKRAFEPVWKVVQVRVKAPQKPKFPREYLFKDDPVEEEEPEIDL